MIVSSRFDCKRGDLGLSLRFRVGLRLAFNSLDEAAKSIGIAPNTLLNWQKLPEFKEAFREARRIAFAQSIARLQQASSVAVSVLVKMMVDPTAPHSTRVRAADSVLGHAAKAIEIEDIDVRVTALEEATKDQKQ